MVPKHVSSSKVVFIFFLWYIVLCRYFNAAGMQKLDIYCCWTPWLRYLFRWNTTEQFPFSPCPFLSLAPHLISRRHPVLKILFYFSSWEAMYRMTQQKGNFWKPQQKLKCVLHALQNATESHSAEHATHTGWHKRTGTFEMRSGSERMHTWRRTPSTGRNFKTLIMWITVS